MLVLRAQGLALRAGEAVLRAGGSRCVAGLDLRTAAFALCCARELVRAAGLLLLSYVARGWS